MGASSRRSLRSGFLATVGRHRLRLRLTAIYGGLFLATGAVLLATTYVLVDHATSSGDNGVSVGVVSDPGAGATAGGSPSPTPLPAGAHVVEAGSAAIETQVSHALDAQHQRMLHQLFRNAVLALLAMSVAAIVIGWVWAGRLLRPLRTIVTTARDISATNLHRRLALPGPPDELTELGATFDELLERLETAFEAQRRFVANASHELRTPLTRQRTLGQLAIADPAASAETLRVAHERILVAGEQQNRVIDALLDLARGQSDHADWETLDLATIAADLVLARRDLAEQRGIAITTDLDSAVTTGDARLLGLLVANLLDNALTHNVEAGTVHLATATTPDEVALLVTNAGPVIPPEVVPALIQPFRRAQADRTSSATGTGLGLSIVDAVATAHRAHLVIEGREAGGLIVRVTFRRAA